MTDPICSDLFRPFLIAANKAFLANPVVRGESNLSEYAKVTESRRFIFDVIDRVETLAFAFTRLEELADDYFRVTEQLDASEIPIPGKPESFSVSDEWQRKEDRLLIETRCLTAFVYYEISALQNALEKVGVKFEGELAYAGKARNKFLAHPNLFHQPARRSAGSLSVKRRGLLLSQAFNTAEFDPLIFEFHFGRPFDPNMFDESDEAIRKNREILVAGRRLDLLSQDEQSRLKVFGIPEPNLELIQAELVELLGSKFLPKIQRIAGKRLPVGR